MSENTNRPELGRLMAPRRNNYFFGQLLDELKLNREQDYFTNMERLVNRLALGSGVLCGLEISFSADGKLCCLSPGVAIDPLGRVIIVPEQTSFDPRQIGDCSGRVTDTVPVERSAIVSVNLCYRECYADYSQYTPQDCDTHDHSAPETVIERFCVQVSLDRTENRVDQRIKKSLSTTAASATAHGRDLCEAVSRQWDGVTEPACVPLGTIELAEGGNFGKVESCSSRTMIYSSTQLLDMILVLTERIDEGAKTVPATPGRAPLTLTVTKDAEVYNKAGQIIKFSITVKNDSSRDLANIVLSSSLDPSLTGLPAQPFIMYAGATSQVYSCSYTVTQDDLDRGDLPVKFSAAVTDLGGRTISWVTRTVDLTADQNPQITATAVAAPTTFGREDENAPIEFAVTIVNNGNVTLTGLTIKSWNGEDLAYKNDRIAPGSVVYVTYTYHISSLDRKRKNVHWVSACKSPTPRIQPRPFRFRVMSLRLNL